MPNVSPAALTINGDRLLQDLHDLAQIGVVPIGEGGGLDRRPFPPAERAARAFFQARAQATGLDVQTDAAANLSAARRVILESMARAVVL
jgi:hypothetical protein